MTLFERHKYINMTTFRKSGKAVPTAVWFVELDGKLYTFTGEQTGKSQASPGQWQSGHCPL